MNPPPPRFPAEGWVTAKAKPTATAASTALPPFFRYVDPNLRGQFFGRGHHAVSCANRSFGGGKEVAQL